MSFVITCGDEGVQINEGTRIGVVGAGFRLEGWADVVKLLKKIFGKDLRIAANEENEWLKQVLELSSWEQVNASAQQHIEALADKHGLLYAGYLPFADPKNLQHDIRGHMVRPHGIHIANKICFTLGGGEQTYNLGNFVISADWVAKAPKALVKSFIGQQIAFYKKLAKNDALQFVFEDGGELGQKTAEANKKALVAAGIV